MVQFKSLRMTSYGKIKFYVLKLIGRDNKFFSRYNYQI